MIEKQTEEALTSDEFVTAERSVVESVVKRERLNVTEVELFKAVDRWATKESERQGKKPEGDVKRRILGEEIVKELRFPMMSQKEFVSVVFDSHILSFQEFGDMMKHYNNVLSTPLPYKQIPRSGYIRRCSRFKNINSPDTSGFPGSGIITGLNLTVFASLLANLLCYMEFSILAHLVVSTQFPLKLKIPQVALFW